MAVMVLALSCMPCMDAAYAMNNGKQEAKISNSTIPKEHKDSDNCPPFCACNCCAGFAYAITAYNSANIVLSVVQKAIGHLSADISEISLPIWEPPKI
jgi:hypothetical protein